MSYFEFPHTRSYDGDLGYIIKRIDELTAKYGEFMEYNQIKFADPVEWNINTVYPAWNIVFANNGYYIAVKPVPAGIMYNNTDYWALIIPFDVDTVLDTESLNPIANSPVARRFNQVSSSISNVVASLQNEGRQREEADAALDTRVTALEEDTEDLSGALTHERTERETADTSLSRNIETLTTRVDNLSQTITPGGTSGDAELADIRVGANGITYPTAGDAVRGQFNELNDTINEYVETNVIYIDESETLTGTGFVYEDIFTCPASEGDVLSISFDSITGATASNYFVIYAKNSENTTIATAYGTSPRLSKSITCPANTASVVFRLYPATEGSVSATYSGIKIFKGDTRHYILNPEIEIESVNEFEEFENKFKLENTKNIFDADWFQGLINGNTGIFTPTTTWINIDSDFIEVDAESDYAISFKKYTLSGTLYIYFYDSNKDYISFTTDYANISTKNYRIFTTPALTRYIRIGFYVADSTSKNDIVPVNIQLEKNSYNTFYIEHNAISTNMLDPNEIIARINEYMLIPNTANEFSLMSYAHRGYSDFAPENTAPAYIYAKRKGFLYVETDIQKTADGHYICNHDSNLLRVTSGVLTGPTENYTLAQLEEVDFGSWKGPQWAGTHVLTFENFMKLCKQLQLKPIVELKRSDSFAEDLQYLCGVVKSLGMENYTSWLTTIALTEVIHQYIPSARVGYNLSAADAATFNPEAASAYAGDGSLFVTVEYTGITQAFINACHEYNIEVSAWIVNDVSTIIELSNINIDIITTDKYIVSEAVLNYYINS